jgi:hypothetical protein
VGLLAEKRTERIDLGDEDWVVILTAFDTRQAAEIGDLQNKSGPEGMCGLLAAIIVEWSEDLPITVETAGQLKPKKTAEILEAFNKRLVLDPKVSSLPSTGTSRARRRHPTKTS